MSATLPWSTNDQPLMLAPMQGLTNRALRQLFIEKYHPDIVFTEFLRVRPSAKKRLSKIDCLEIKSHNSTTGLVVQLIGRHPDDLVCAAREAQDMGAVHINLNMGCPFGRMAGNSAGGALMKNAAELPAILSALRKNVNGGLSVKMRSGFADPRQIFDLLPIFAAEGVDFLVLHPRTVAQKYTGMADHKISAEVVTASPLPVIVNGDIRTASQGRAVLDATKAAGLMIGRGAIADPWLFARLKGIKPGTANLAERRQEINNYLTDLLPRYEELYCGDTQVLNKLKSITRHFDDPELTKEIKKIQRSKNLHSFTVAVAALETK